MTVSIGGCRGRSLVVRDDRMGREVRFSLGKDGSVAAEARENYYIKNVVIYHSKPQEISGMLDEMMKNLQKQTPAAAIEFDALLKEIADNSDGSSPHLSAALKVLEGRLAR